METFSKFPPTKQERQPSPIERIVEMKGYRTTYLVFMTIHFVRPFVDIVVIIILLLLFILKIIIIVIIIYSKDYYYC